MHLLLKHTMLQFIFEISFLIWLLHVSVPSDHHQGAYDGTLSKLVSLKSLVKIVKMLLCSGNASQFVVCALGAVRHVLIKGAFVGRIILCIKCS